MEVSTKLFGNINVGDDKIIEFPEGILGFPELKKFTLMYDNDKNTAGGMRICVQRGISKEAVLRKRITWQRPMAIWSAMMS